MIDKYPKVLILARGVWDDKAGTSSTESNFFGNYDHNKISQIYIESKMPNTKLCSNFFQISEYALIQRIFNKKIVSGKEIHSLKHNRSNTKSNAEKKEESIMNHVRQNRLWFYTFAREILWLFNGWKSKELNNYVENDDLDVLFINCYPLIFMNRLQNYIIKKSKKPAVFFFRDDVYTYKSCKGGGLFRYVYKYFLRLSVKRVVGNCDVFFVASPKMKKEYDTIFKINSKILTKGIDFTNHKSYSTKKINTPIKIVYLGQILYGRDHSLIAMVNALKKINEKSLKVQLYVYTGNYISKEKREKLEIKDTSFIMPLVPYDQVQIIMQEADIVLFVESLNEKYKNIARLSFSTKLTDYFSSGKCIFAIGANDVAPIEYLKENDAAIVACSQSEIENKITNLVENKHLIDEYSEKSFKCGKQKHDLNNINNLLYKTIHDLAW